LTSRLGAEVAAVVAAWSPPDAAGGKSGKGQEQCKSESARTHGNNSCHAGGRGFDREGGLRESHAVKDILFGGGSSGWQVIQVQSLCRDRP